MVMTLFHGLICGVVALYTTQDLRSPCLMMAVRKRQNIVQWSYRRVPLNVVPRIPLLGYPDIDQRYLDWSPSLRQTVPRNMHSAHAENAHVGERAVGQCDQRYQWSNRHGDFARSPRRARPGQIIHSQT